MNRSGILLFPALLWFLNQSAIAETINYLPNPSNYSTSVALNSPASGDVWNGVAQSFTALDPRVEFGFYFPSFLAPNLVFTLYGGDGINENSILAVRSASVVGPFTAQASLVAADFSSITLSVGSKYTVAANLPGYVSPSTGAASSEAIYYAGYGVDFNGDMNPYSGGRLYYTGAALSSFMPADWDLAFRVIAVPEPSPAVLLGTGMVVVFLSRKLRPRALSRA